MRHIILMIVLSSMLAACAPEEEPIGDTDSSLTQEPGDPPPPPSLKTVAIPKPDLSGIVADEQAAIVLGKALFWDMQVGSDGVTACATCHFQAGADSRSKNQRHPGADGKAELNDRWERKDFPFRKLEDPDDRASRVISDRDDIAGSQGVRYSRLGTRRAKDPDGFSVHGVNVRRLESRNTPTVINAVYNFRNFWDGRAQERFNGRNASGDRDPSATVQRIVNGKIEEVRLSIPRSSLASQAMQPPLSSIEMSAEGRTFEHIAEELLDARPLGKQMVDCQDSVLGPYSRAPRRGLNVDYATLIRRAFVRDLWDQGLMKTNFSLFFGLAIQAYEATLVSDDTRFDRFREGDENAMSALEKRGLELFLSQKRGRCINCHGGPELTDASVTRWSKNQIRRREGNVFDFGFNNIGVRPTGEDLGNGGTDPFGAPLSVTRLAMQGGFSDPTMPLGQNESLGVDGGFKVPGLRNVELTAPYFHNGGALTLRQVIDFYSRGGDFVPIKGTDGNTISPLSLPRFTEEEKDALEAFLLSLTDERVRYRKAPFDHPQLFVPDGQMGTSCFTVGIDLFREVPAVGRLGGKPLPGFLQGTSVDGPGRRDYSND